MFPADFDIFCRVVDNYGDAGVCWRLARQLANEHRARVRLWFDNLDVLHKLCPEVDLDTSRQHVSDVEICCWNADVADARPAQVVVEAFGCGLPDAYAEVMACRHPVSLWIVLEYLSAEPWVNSHHGLASPPPRLQVPRYFFFPGFVPGTGGVLCEKDLIGRRDAFGEKKRRAFWTSISFDAPPEDSLTISMFAYGDAPIAELLDIMAQGDAKVVVAVSPGDLASRLRQSLQSVTDNRYLSGKAELRFIPFLPQRQYDELLWSCDINFVRGEDSFVRAQWAGRPFVWQIYRQEEQAHAPKLAAFLDRYCEGLSGVETQAVRGIWQSWNGISDSSAIAAAWRAFTAAGGRLNAHAGRWPERLAAPGDLAGNLVKFCQNLL